MLRVTYVGHATVQIEVAGIRLLTDPVLRARVMHIRRLATLPDTAALEEPDAVLISHGHHDHLDVPSLRPLRPRQVVAPPGCGRRLRRAGLSDVTEVRPEERVCIRGIGVRVLRMDHAGDAVGYLIECSPSVFFAGDTDVFPEMRELAGSVDVALLPIWGWGSRLGRGHMDPVRAAQAAAWIRPRVAIPIHWGTFASPRARWRADPEAPARAFRQRVGLLAPEVEVRVLPPGASTEIVRSRAPAASSRRSPRP